MTFDVDTLKAAGYAEGDTLMYPVGNQAARAAATSSTSFVGAADLFKMPVRLDRFVPSDAQPKISLAFEAGAGPGETLTVKLTGSGAGSDVISFSTTESGFNAVHSPIQDVQNVPFSGTEIIEAEVKTTPGNNSSAAVALAVYIGAEL
jgi:hypothetical protein